MSSFQFAEGVTEGCEWRVFQVTLNLICQHKPNQIAAIDSCNILPYSAQKENLEMMQVKMVQS